jgi:hypothetical protein
MADAFEKLAACNATREHGATCNVSDLRMQAASCSSELIIR